MRPLLVLRPRFLSDLRRLVLFQSLRCHGNQDSPAATRPFPGLFPEGTFARNELILNFLDLSSSALEVLR